MNVSPRIRVRNLLFLVLFLCAASYAEAQTCSGTVELNRQSQVDAFSCTTFAGFLTISSDVTDPITNLAGLSELETVDGDLSIVNSSELTSLAGLDALTTVGGALSLSGLPQVASLDGLGSLETVGDVLFVAGNDALEDLRALVSLESYDGLIVTSNRALTSLDGLPPVDRLFGVSIRDNGALLDAGALAGLSDVTWQVFIEGNPLLTDLEWLSSLETVGAFVRVAGNNGLTSLRGLESLETIGGVFDIVQNDQLTSLDGLSVLRSVGGTLQVYGNDALTSLDGLSSLRDVGGALQVIWNGALTSIDGLGGLETVSGNLEVSSNGRLSNCDCGLYGLLTSGGVGGTVSINSNAPGCNNPSEIMEPAPGSCPFPTQGEETPGGPSRLVLGANPTADVLSLRASFETVGPARIAVYDLVGRRVGVAHDGPSGTELSLAVDVSDWAPGVYVARLDAEGRAESVAFTVAR